MPREKKKTVAVAMSGGVDSSVAAWMLLQQGYDVFGLTMAHIPPLVSSNAAENKLRTSAEKDAAMVCTHFGISHHLVDLQTVFEEKIIHRFVEEYLRGRTPNPCVLCNVHIKWGALLNQAEKFGADYFATGHYARLQYNATDRRIMLLKAKYQAKDQSYALWGLQQKHLLKTKFPLGELSKEQVRNLAENISLPVARKAESQEICFIPDDDYKKFLQHFLSASGRAITAGDLCDSQNRILGKHGGYPFYTIGQRKGLGVALGRPVYVTHIDAERNRIVVGDKKDLLAKGLIAEQVNLISVENIAPQTKVKVRIRYKDPGYAATVDWIRPGIMCILFDEPRPAVTPGQSAVLYDDHRLLAGGIIRRALT